MLIHLKTLGCRLNEAELETWAHEFQKSGHIITRTHENAQVIIINSCAVTEDAARKSRGLIRRIHRDNPKAKLVVTGCYATMNLEQVASLLGVDLIIANHDKQHLVTRLLAELNFDTMPEMSSEPSAESLFSRGRQRAFIKVQDGCRYHCTFCIVTIARGEEFSRSVSEIINEINALHVQGIQEVILTGVHLGGYGSDISSNLTDLITSILKDTGIPRLRLGSLEPWELSNNFFELFSNPRLMPHMHLPLQSGSNSVLRRMARRCKTEEYARIVNTIREQNPFFNITTDIIVGFPGETEQEWQQSLDFIQQTGFGHIHIFTYSKREHTTAASFANHISNDIKKQRSQHLHVLAQTMKQAFWQKNIGREYPVLWEGYKETLENGKQRVFGYSPNYLKVGCEIDALSSVENKIIATHLKEAKENHIAGEFSKAEVLNS